MRTPNDAKGRWQATFANASDLSILRSAIHSRGEESPCGRGLRSVCWKAFLVFENLDQSTWMTIIDESRNTYSSLRDHFLRLLQNPDDASSIDPLADFEDSPWNTLRQDEMLRAEILQDVERCMPEYPFFRESSTKDALVDILFIYCKLNADVGYRQGMHELLAPIFWVISQDAVDRHNVSDDDGGGELIWSVLDSQYVLHDAFTLFCIVMQTAKSFYDTRNSSQASSAEMSNDSPIIARSQRIFNGYLRKTDRELMNHLKEIDVLPQIFVLRWIRLLFGREFPFEDVLCLWDLLFAEDPTFRLIDLVCVAMLLRIRWQLLDADYTSALTLLLRYPSPPPEHSPMTFLEDAMFLRSHLSSEGGSQLIAKYTGKAPAVEERRSRSLHTPQASADFTRKSSLRSPTRYIQESGGIESMLQEAAKGVYKRSERLGLNQALRGAVQQIQAVNSSPRRYIAAARRSLDGAPTADLDNQDLRQRIGSLEGRNRALAKLIQAAMNELTDQARVLEEEKHETAVNKLILTIAKLQFVHIYLDDPTMPLDDEASPSQDTSATVSRTVELAPPVEDEETISWSPTEPKDQRGRSPISQSRAVPSFRVQPQTSSTIVRESPTRKYIPRRRPPSVHGATPPTTSLISITPNKNSQPSTSAPSPRHAAHGSPLQKPRPSLAQSSFSWMLGSTDEEGDKRSFMTASPFPPEHERIGVADKKNRGRAGFLFGDDGDSSFSDARVGIKDNSKEDDDGFTLGTLQGVSKET